MLERAVYTPAGKLPPEVVSQFQGLMESLRTQAENFVDRMADEILAQQPRIVGCTSSFQQHVPALALLRRLRERDPDLITMMGGANCETIMGLTTHRSFEWVDYVVSGEADELIVDLVGRVLADGRDVAAADLALGVFGPVHRESGYPPAGSDGDAPRCTSSCLTHLPVPDFGAYFEALEATGLSASVTPGLPIETSRGCWWGERSHCTFCGLNGVGMTYRRRPAEDVLAEFEAQAERYGSNRFEVVDNILDMRFMSSVLPRLAERKTAYEIFYEVKANLKRDQVRMLRAAGVVWIQPGIESMHSKVLALMRKGSKAWINVQLLKWCREFGIRTSWSVLFAFPHEEDDWYREMAQWFPLVHHLQPPDSMMSVRIDRYSPYHADRESFGLRLRPSRMSPFVYPLSDEVLMDLAYFFEQEGDVGYGSNAAVGSEFARPGVAAAQQAQARWLQAFWSKEAPVLSLREDGDALEILDTRACATAPVHRLEGLARELLLLCDEAPLANRVTESCGADAAEVAAALEDLRSRRLLLELDGRLLNLAVRGDSPALPRSPEFPGGFVRVPAR